MHVGHVLVCWDVCKDFTECHITNALQVVVATGGGHLVYLEVQAQAGGAAVVEVANVTLDSEVACVDVSPLLLTAGPGGWAGWVVPYGVDGTVVSAGPMAPEFPSLHSS